MVTRKYFATFTINNFITPSLKNNFFKYWNGLFFGEKSVSLYLVIYQEIHIKSNFALQNFKYFHLFLKFTRIKKTKSDVLIFKLAALHTIFQVSHEIIILAKSKSVNIQQTLLLTIWRVFLYCLFVQLLFF